MDQKFIDKLKSQIKNAEGDVSDALKTEINNSLDSLFHQLVQVKSDLQATVRNYITLIASKNLTISTQAELIETQKNLIENQKLLLNYLIKENVNEENKNNGDHESNEILIQRPTSL